MAGAVAWETAAHEYWAHMSECGAMVVPDSSCWHCSNPPPRWEPVEPLPLVLDRPAWMPSL